MRWFVVLLALWSGHILQAAEPASKTDSLLVASRSAQLRVTLAIPDSPRVVAILLPMLGKSVESWSELLPDLSAAQIVAVMPALFADTVRRGTATIPADTTGSLRDSPISSYSGDLRAVTDAMRVRFPDLPQTVVGAGLGANVALNYLQADTAIRAAVLLSPGLDFRSVELPAEPIAINARVLAVAARDDDYAFVSLRELLRLNPYMETIEFEKGGHGTYLLESHPELLDSLTSFLRRAAP